MCRDLAFMLAHSEGESLNVRAEEVRKERDGIPQPIKADDQEWNRLHARAEAIEHARRSLQNLMLPLEAFPDDFLRRFDDAIAVDPVNGKREREHAETWSEEMRSLKERLDFNDAERCLVELDKFWQRK